MEPRAGQLGARPGEDEECFRRRTLRYSTQSTGGRHSPTPQLQHHAGQARQPDAVMATRSANASLPDTPERGAHTRHGGDKAPNGRLRRRPSQDDTREARIGHKRRRKLACHHCHRLKTRCDYDASAQTCRRCQNLRLECSIIHEASEGQRAAVDQSSGNLPTGSPVTLETINESVAALRRELHGHISASRPGHRPSITTAPATLPDAHGILLREPADSENPLSDPPDKSIQTAPISIIREVNVAVEQRRQRQFPDTSADIVAAGILSETEAVQLATKFCQNHHDLLHIPDADTASMVWRIRSSSPFLFAVCCFNAAAYRISPGTDITEPLDLLNDHVMTTLGRVLLLSPIPTDSIYAIMVMSTLTTPNRSRKHFVDSWLLSGYAVQQAMLVIDFTKINDNIRSKDVSAENVRHLRLWGAICLNHLHFSIGCGRPPVMAPAYMDQAYLVLDSLHDTIEDEYIIAEILLYRCLQRILNANIGIGRDGLSEHLEAWRKDWRRLLGVTNYELLDISYHFVYIVVAMRSLELLRDQTPAQTQTRSRSSTAAVVVPEEKFLIDVACEHAKWGLNYANKARRQARMALTTFRYMNIGYCALTLSKYINASSIPPKEAVDLISETQKHIDKRSKRIKSILSFALSQALKRWQVDNSAAAWCVAGDLVITPENPALDPSIEFGYGDALSLEDIYDCFPSFGSLFTDGAVVPEPFM